MSTLHNTYDPINDLILSKGLRILSLRFEGKSIFITLNKRQIIRDSLDNYPRLKDVSNDDLVHYKLIADGIGVHWPAIDEDLSLYGLVKDYFTKNFQVQKELVIS